MASEKIVQEKQAAVDALAAELNQAKTIVLADFLGLTVSEDSELRKNLREANVTYKVVKNNIGRRAVEAAGLGELADQFVGPTSIAYSDDVVAPAKVINDFSKDHETISLKAGASNGHVLSDEKLEALANVPGLEELYTRLAGAVQFPIKHYAMIIQALADKLEEEDVETPADLDVEAASDDAEAEEKEEDKEAASAETEDEE